MEKTSSIYAAAGNKKKTNHLTGSGQKKSIEKSAQGAKTLCADFFAGAGAETFQCGVQPQNGYDRLFAGIGGERGEAGA